METTNNDIYIRGQKLYTPSEYPTITLADLQESGVRSFATGVMKLNTIRKNVFSIDLQWSNIPLSEATNILKIMVADSDGAMQCNAFFPELNARKDMRVYMSDRTFAQYPYKNGIYASLSVTLIEL